MGFPSKLKNMNFFGDGESFLGTVAEVTPPKLVLKMEDYRGGGMLGPIGVDQGLEKFELEFKAGGILAGAVRQFGAVEHSAQLNRFAGAYQNDNTGGVEAVEIVTRGRIAEIDFGTAKPGDDTEHTFKVMCTYYKMTVAGVEWFEIDLAGAIFRVFGRDRYAEIRAAIGA